MSVYLISISFNCLQREANNTFLCENKKKLITGIYVFTYIFPLCGIKNRVSSDIISKGLLSENSFCFQIMLFNTVAGTRFRSFGREKPTKFWVY